MTAWSSCLEQDGVHEDFLSIKGKVGEDDKEEDEVRIAGHGGSGTAPFMRNRTVYPKRLHRNDGP
jgi:hypothetical protein